MPSFELYSFDNKVPIEKCFEMLNILADFYDDFNGMDNRKKEMYEPWFNVIRNTKDYYVLLCYKNSNLIGFLNYMYYEEGLVLCEVQIKKEFQNKGYMKLLIKKAIENSDLNRYSDIFVTINKNNIVSQSIFRHIGFKNIENNLYSIDKDKLLLWVNS